MSYKLEKAKTSFKFGIDNYFQPVIDEKEKIIEGLKILSKGASNTSDLFQYSILQFYDFLEKDFGPRIKSIENQIEEGKLSKREYDNILEDSSPKGHKNIFTKNLGYLEAPAKNYKTAMILYKKTDEKALFAYNQIFENFLFLEETILALKDIIKYGVVKEDNENYYFDWYRDTEKGDSETEDEEVEKDDYYSKHVKAPIVEDKEYEPILIYENLQLKSQDGQKSITVRKKQKLLCDLIFSTGYLKNNTYTFLGIEEKVYDKEPQNIEAIKSLIKNVKGKLDTLGYENIIEYTNEILIVKAIV